MFIREVVKKTKGKEYFQHQLIESVRTPVGPRHKLVLNLGIISLPKDKWKTLANLIESIVNNQQRLFEEDADIERLARQYARKIRKKRLAIEAEGRDIEGEEEKEDYEEVNINSLCTSDSRSIGPEHVILSQIEDYGFDKILKEVKFDDNQITYAKMLVVARLIHPDSERETVRWINEASAISELLQTNIKVYDNALHRTAVKLWEHHRWIEDKLAEAARKSFALKETVILYDLTNTYFEGSKKDSKIAKHGAKSKERRNDRPLVTLALTVDEEGFPKQSKIYEGNISEPKTLEHILKELSCRKDFFTSEKTIVIDAGIASEDNLALIKEKKFKYIAVSRKKSYEDTLWSKSEEQEINLADGTNKLKIKLARKDDEAYLLCHSTMKKEKEESILSRRMQSFENALKEINEKLQQKNTQKKYEKIIERIGRLKERYGVGNLYDIKTEKKDDHATNIKFTKNSKGKAKEDGFGNYVLRTNRLDLSGEAISQIHRSLTRIEDCFKGMKAIGLRPNYHQQDKTTAAHIHVTVIAYHILSGVLKKLRTAGMHKNWKSIQNMLITHRRETATMNTKDKKIINVRICTTPTDKQYNIYRILRIKQKPLKRVTTKTYLGKGNNLDIKDRNFVENGKCSDENNHPERS